MEVAGDNDFRVEPQPGGGTSSSAGGVFMPSSRMMNASLSAYSEQEILSYVQELRRNRDVNSLLRSSRFNPPDVALRFRHCRSPRTRHLAAETERATNWPVGGYRVRAHPTDDELHGRVNPGLRPSASCANACAIPPKDWTRNTTSSRKLIRTGRVLDTARSACLGDWPSSVSSSPWRKQRRTSAERLVKVAPGMNLSLERRPSPSWRRPCNRTSTCPGASSSQQDLRPDHQP